MLGATKLPHVYLYAILACATGTRNSVLLELTQHLNWSSKCTWYSYGTTTILVAVGEILKARFTHWKMHSNVYYLNQETGTKS